MGKQLVSFITCGCELSAQKGIIGIYYFRPKYFNFPLHMRTRYKQYGGTNEICDKG
jgi:hypothetical protein